MEMESVDRESKWKVEWEGSGEKAKEVEEERVDAVEGKLALMEKRKKEISKCTYSLSMGGMERLQDRRGSK